MGPKHKASLAARGDERTRAATTWAAVAFTLGLVGCDYHQSYRPTSARVIANDAVDISLMRVGDDHTTFSLQFLVRNHTGQEMTFHPDGARLIIGEQTAAPFTTRMGVGAGNEERTRAVVDGLTTTVRSGPAHGLEVAATGFALAGLDEAIMIGINEAARGPHASSDQIVAPGKSAVYTLQFPIYLSGNETFVVPATDVSSPPIEIPIADGCRLALGSALRDSEGNAVAVSDLDVVDVHSPHDGFEPPSPPHAVFLARLGFGPGFGKIGAVGGLEIGAGPRWGKTELRFSAALGPGFPLAVDSGYELVDRSSWSLTTTLGDAIFLYPTTATELRGGVEIAVKTGSSFGYRGDFLKLGGYARGGPMLFRGAPIGASFEVGAIVGAF